MRTQRLQNDWLPIFDGKVLKFLKRHVEVNLNIVVAADANGFDELRNDHFLCLKGAVVIHLALAYQLVIFPQHLAGRLYGFFQLGCGGLNLHPQLLDLFHSLADKAVQQVCIQAAGALDDLDRLSAQVLILPLLLPILLI